MAAETVRENAQLGAEDQWAVVIIDHGSRRKEANAMLEDVAQLYRRETGSAIVETAHMELTEPSLKQAVDSCVSQGATKIVVAPLFLGPGRHIQEDIPRLTEEAASAHPGVECRVAGHLGVDTLLVQLLKMRVQQVLS